jgi:hypothetical protein
MAAGESLLKKPSFYHCFIDEGSDAQRRAFAKLNLNQRLSPMRMLARRSAAALLESMNRLVILMR